MRKANPLRLSEMRRLAPPSGEDVTEVLEYVPGSFRVTRHVRPKLSCRACETIAQAPAPSLGTAGVTMTR